MTLTETNKDIQENIFGFKVKAFLEKFIAREQSPILFEIPKVVIYAINGPTGAQKVLNSIYRRFKDWSGLGRTPQFNEKVTDLIYFAQGSRDDKKDFKFAQYFEKGNVYYKSNVVDLFDPEYKKTYWPDLKVGELPEFHLQNPAHDS